MASNLDGRANRDNPIRDRREIRELINDLYRQKNQLQQASSILGKMIAECEYQISSYNRQLRALGLETLPEERKGCLGCGKAFTPTKQLPDHCSYRCYREAGTPAVKPFRYVKESEPEIDPDKSMTVDEFVNQVGGDVGTPAPAPENDGIEGSHNKRRGLLGATENGCDLHDSCLTCPFPVCYEESAQDKVEFLREYGHLLMPVNGNGNGNGHQNGHVVTGGGLSVRQKVELLRTLDQQGLDDEAIGQQLRLTANGVAIMRERFIKGRETS